MQVIGLTRDYDLLLLLFLVLLLLLAGTWSFAGSLMLMAGLLT
jgi:hypothetical protein